MIVATAEMQLSERGSGFKLEPATYNVETIYSSPSQRDVELATSEPGYSREAEREGRTSASIVLMETSQ